MKKKINSLIKKCDSYTQLKIAYLPRIILVKKKINSLIKKCDSYTQLKIAYLPRIILVNQILPFLKGILITQNLNIGENCLILN